MLVFVNTPVKPRHKAMLEEAAAGRCRLVYGEEYGAPPADCDAIIGTLQPEHAAMVPNLKWLQLAWAGADHIVKRLPEEVLLTNSSGAYGVMIAEHMMATLLALVRQLRHYDRLQTAHHWLCPWHETTLEGRTVLIFGTGDLGQSLARRLQGFDCRVIGIRRSPAPVQYFHEVYGMDEAERLLAQADVVACTLPGTAETVGWFHKERLLQVKPGALLINCGRGTFIPGRDLTEVLQMGHLAGAALDVTDPEPLPPESPLWDMENVIITPHISGASFGHMPEVEDKIYRIAAENLDLWLSGKPLKRIVNKQRGY